MQPKVKVRGQYIKDFSFENPNAPRVFLMMSKTPPEINITVNVSSVGLPVKPAAEGEAPSVDLYEVTLQVKAESVVEKVAAFVCEIKYCGVFAVEGAEDEAQLKAALLITAPGILFPFLREVVSKVTASAGFPPLMLEVIDFAEMFEKQIVEGGASQE
ncbi:protein-export protein SecB [Anaplasma platys]|uniref:Protein-export protein SecB n=1 Tax=Anaplasma platys TaxID=949 RepID=A0A858PXD5_9RICK|nr:protein-export chaperone SecB [Anaplasma platys]QJC27240.1 protein-export protein SecB [Anaplasma platys]